MSLIQRIKCKLGYHYGKSMEYIGYDDITGILTLRCIKCKTKIIIGPIEDDDEP